MMPTLHAEESMRAAERVAVGSGTLEKRAMQRVTAGWRRDMGHTPPAPVKGGSGQHAAVLGTMGIGYRRVKRTTADG